MKHLFTTILLLVALLLPATALASQRYQFESDCVYYKIVGNKAMVTCMYDNSYYDEDCWVDSYSSDYSGFVVIPETVNYNGVTYPVTAIDSYTFYKCSGLTSVTIPNSITSIGEGAFYGCSGLTSIPIANSVTSISNYVFYDCDGLTSVTIPNTVKTIGNSAFRGCNGLTSINIPNSVTSIGGYAFCSCKGLTSIDIPNSVTSIGDYAFWYCTNLSSINIPNSVTSIGSGAFDDTAWYDNQPNGVVYAGYVAYCYKGTMPGGTIISLKYGTVGIANEAFACYDPEGDYSYTPPHPLGNNALGGINMPNTLKVIGSYSFEYCYGLTSINIPSSVISIGNGAFYDCYHLTDVFSFIDNPSIVSMGSSVFYSSNEDAALTLHVPFGTKSAYQAIPKWRYFYSIVEMEPDTILATSIDLNQSNAEVNVGGNVQLTATVLPEDATDKTVTWASNDESVTTVDENGLVTAVAPGTATITATTNDGSALSASCDVTVLQNNVLVTSIDLNQSNAEVNEGGTLQLTATVLPEDATDKTVTWASNNESVASVDDNGLVTAVGLGTATITAMTTDGSNLSASCQVTVTSESATNMFVIQDAEVLHGDSITIPVALTNDQTILAFQTDIYLPEGFSIVTSEDNEYVITPSGRLTEDHVIITTNVSSGALRVMCYSHSAMPIEGNEGDLFYFTVRVPENAAGDYTIYLRNSRLTTADFNELRAPDAGTVLTVKTFIPGDANDSHSVNVADIVTTAMYIMEMEPTPFVFEAADMNGDGEITVTDIMLIARLVLYPNGIPVRAQAPAISGNSDRMSGEGVSLTPGETRTVSILLDNETDYSAFQLDMTLPEGLTATNFQLTDRAGSHALDVKALRNGKTRVLCYTPAIEAINGHEGAVLTFDVTASGATDGNITVDGIEMVTTTCEMVRLDSFTIGVNNVTTVNEVTAGKTVARVDYFNVAGQRIDRPDSGVTLVVTTYTDGTRSTTKLHR